MEVRLRYNTGGRLKPGMFTTWKRDDDLASRLLMPDTALQTMAAIRSSLRLRPPV
jgi:hypothetical protein